MPTTLPIDVTPERLLEFLAATGTIRVIGWEELGRDVYADPSPAEDDTVGVDLLWMALNGATGDELRAYLYASEEGEAWRTRPPDPGPVPPDPGPGPGPDPGPIVPGDEAGPITIRRPAMYTETGEVWQWRGFTDFLLFYRVLCNVDVTPFLTERIALGANVLRVFSMVGWDECNPRFYPGNFPDYYQRLRDFVDLCASVHIRVELTVFADAQVVMPNADVRNAHLTKILDTLQGCWNVFIEVSNEPFKNLPGGNEEAIQLAAQAQGHGFLIASGEYSSWPPAETADYGTTHCDRTEDWPRKSKDLFDRCNGSNQTPWVGDEPMGCAEQTDPGRRDSNPDHHAQYAATSAMFGPGSTFHCEAGIHSFTPVPPVQAECAKRFFDALKWMPTDACLRPYQRGDMGSEAGIGDMPILHDDAVETRSYCKGDGSTEWCVQVQTVRTHATPRDGWRIVDEPWTGFVKLVKP